MLYIEQLIQSKIRALQDVTLNIFDYLLEAFEKNADKFQEANIKQLDAGILSTGAPIKAPNYLPYDLYSPETRRRKRIKGQPVDRITLKDTGAFYKSIKVELNTQGFEMDASDPKTRKLENKYTVDILGISEENLNIILEQIEKDLLFSIKIRIENA